MYGWFFARTTRYSWMVLDYYTSSAAWIHSLVAGYLYDCRARRCVTTSMYSHLVGTSGNDVPAYAIADSTATPGPAARRLTTDGGAVPTGVLPVPVRHPTHYAALRPAHRAS